MAVFSFLMFCGYLTTGTMGFVDIEVFFPNLEGNLTKVVWAHAVNNATYLNDTLLKNDIMMIEADVQMGILSNDSTVIIPVMAHPPNNVSDLSLEMFLKKVDEHNKKNKNGITKKGIKLDFKQIDAFINSTNIIRSFSSQVNYPIWINADILSGPISAAGSTPVNASLFLEGAKTLKDVELSVGWTTYYGSHIIGQYSDEDIDQMIDTLKEHNVKDRITFTVRAGLAALSKKQINRLLTQYKHSTLTIWSNEGDFVKVDLLRKLIGSVGVKKVFIDLPDILKSQLRLNNFPKPNNGFKTYANLLLIILTSLIVILNQIS